jgi:hypothetical protein
MKKVLLLTLAVLMISSVAMADHIGVYTDASGSSCLIAPGSSSVTIVHKFSLGTTLSRWKIVLAPGSTFFAFNSPYPAIGTATSDISVAYGSCMTGSFSIGQVFGAYSSGEITIVAADGQPYIIYANCDFAELPASGGSAWSGGATGDCHEVATEQSTWGSVKALYR